MNRRFFLVLIFSFLFPVNVYGKDEWQLAFQPRQRVVKTIGVFDDKLFIGTGNGVFVSNDTGKTWEDFGSSQLLKDNSGNSRVNWIFTDATTEKIYLATSFGTYFSDIYKPDWQKLFESKKIESNEINSLTVDSKNAYLATNDGFWICSLNTLDKCERLNQGLEPDSVSGNYEISYVLKNNDDLFLAASNGIYSFNKEDSNWQKISNSIQFVPNGRINARHLVFDSKENLWAACGTGVYLTKDKGLSWIKISNGLQPNNEGFLETYYLLELNNVLYVTAASGVYYLDDNNWTSVSGGIRTKDNNKNVYWLADFKDNLYSATDEGLFVLEKNDKQYGKDAPSGRLNGELVLKGKIEKDFGNLDELEPSVIEIQKQALKFASLPTTDDYKRYRVQARLRNFIPRLGFDINTTGTNTDYYEFDKGIATDISLNNKFDSGRTTRYERDGRSFKQLSVLWNTNQFIYDDEIREILNQARLTANIKENLLDDVTRIFYQRRRLQLESLLYPEIEIGKKLNKELEINELTGQLDSRTGGWFSREVEKRKYAVNGKYAKS